MTAHSLSEHAARVADQARALAGEAESLALHSAHAAQEHIGGGDMLVTTITVFSLAVIVGYYVVWGVTPALHSPLMAVTNAISSVIIVGALLAVGSTAESGGMSTHKAGADSAALFGFFAIILASINIFGGFVVSQRMLAMFKKKSPSNTKARGDS